MISTVTNAPCTAGNPAPRHESRADPAWKTEREIFRVEDTIMHICRAYGLHSVHIFVLSNGIFLSCGDETEPLFAKVLQVPVNNTNLRRVAEVNQLSRRIEEEGLYPRSMYAES